MMTLGTWSDDTFTGAPADPADTLTFLERASRTAELYGREVNDEWQGPMRPGLSALYDAAERQARLVDGSSARRAAREDVYDRMIAEVRRVTGEDLANPLMRNTTEIAGRIGRGEFNGWADPRLDELIAGREDAFLARIQELKAKLGDRLAVDPFTTIPAQARANAAQAEADFKREWAREDLPLLGQLGALFAGGMIGSREDPLFWLSLGFGGPAKNAATPLARITTSAISNAVANAAFSAVAQPTVQNWRREIGVENGLGEALQNVGMAFAIGGVAGGGMTGIGELVARIGKGRGAADRAVKAIEDAGGFVDDDTRAALKAAEMAGEADDATLRLPDGVNPAEAVDGLRDAMRAAVEVDAPLPMGSRPVRPGVTDALARDILDNAEDPVTGLARLRENPDAIESAIASDLPDVRAAGYAATLGDAAFARVMAGEVDPVVASVVARMVDDEASQAAMLGRLVEAGARTEEAAREVVSDAIRARNAVAAAQAAMADEGPVIDVEMVMRRQPLRRAPLSLIDYLASIGGLKPDGELAAIFDGNKFVPMYGQLIRKDGKTLDQAFEAGLEAGYFRDNRFDAGGTRSLSYNDMLVAIEAEHHGRKLYTEADRGLIADREMAERNAELRRMVEQQMERFFVENDIQPHTIDKKLWARTREMLERGEFDDPDIAFERAVMEDSHRFETVAAKRKEITRDIPGWDLPDDRRPAPPTRPASAAATDAGPGGARAPGQEPRIGGQPDRRTETTPAGEQQLIPGVDPLDPRAIAELAAAQPLRGGDAAPPAGGLFDDAARGQMDLMDSAAMRRADPAETRNLVPMVDDAGNAVAVDRASLDQVGERPRLLADIVTACRI